MPADRTTTPTTREEREEIRERIRRAAHAYEAVQAEARVDSAPSRTLRAMGPVNDESMLRLLDDADEREAAIAELRVLHQMLGYTPGSVDSAATILSMILTSRSDAIARAERAEAEVASLRAEVERLTHVVEVRDRDLAAVRANRDAEIARLAAALREARSDLWLLVEGRHGPKAASEYPSIVAVDAALRAFDAPATAPAQTAEMRRCSGCAGETWFTDGRCGWCRSSDATEAQGDAMQPDVLAELVAGRTDNVD